MNVEWNFNIKHLCWCERALLCIAVQLYNNKRKLFQKQSKLLKFMKYYLDKKKLSFGIMCNEESFTITQKKCINKVNRIHFDSMLT